MKLRRQAFGFNWEAIGDKLFWSNDTVCKFHQSEGLITSLTAAYGRLFFTTARFLYEVIPGLDDFIIYLVQESNGLTNA
jgi:hypothetical protein